MPDRRKTGRISQPSIEERVRTEYSRIKRPDTLEHMSRPRTGDTVHMALAKRFGITCQEVLDIIDPDRSAQAVRIRRHAERVRSEAEYQHSRALNSVINTLLAGDDPVAVEVAGLAREALRDRSFQDYDAKYGPLDGPTRVTVLAGV